MKKKITLLESQLHEANEQINSIKKEIEELKQKKSQRKGSLHPMKLSHLRNLQKLVKIQSLS